MLDRVALSTIASTAMPLLPITVASTKNPITSEPRMMVMIGSASACFLRRTGLVRGIGGGYGPGPNCPGC